LDAIRCVDDVLRVDLEAAAKDSGRSMSNVAWLWLSAQANEWRASGSVEPGWKYVRLDREQEAVSVLYARVREDRELSRALVELTRAAMNSPAARCLIVGLWETIAEAGGAAESPLPRPRPMDSESNGPAGE